MWTSATKRLSVGNETVPSGDQAAVNAMEITIIWNGTVQSVVEKPLDEKGETSFYIGEDPTCDFVVSAEQTGGAARFPVAAVRGGVFEVRALPTMALRILREDGFPKPYAEDDILLPSDGVRSCLVSDRETAEIESGEVVFRLRMTKTLERVRGGLTLDRNASKFIGLSAVVHAAVLFAFYLVPPDAAGLQMDNMEEYSQIMKIMLSAPEARLIETPKPEPGNNSKAGGEAHAGTEGKMGDRTSKKTNNRSGIKGPSDNRNPVMAREYTQETAATAGILGMLSSVKMPRSPFGSDNPMGFDPENALGALVGDKIGANAGLDGLALHGTGRGGGGDGKGTIGVGKLGRLAWNLSKGTCVGDHCPPGGPGAGLGGYGKGGMNGRRNTGPKLRSGEVTARGSLSKEVIRRIVRRHLNEIRFCYEKGLAKRPDLAGQVAVKFTITDKGVVQSALISNSTLGDPGVEMCISQTVRRMTFPMPPGSGLVLVTYPFSLTASM